MKGLLFILGILVLAACGGGDATDTADDVSPATPTTIAAPTTTVATTIAAPTTTVATIEETPTTTEVAAIVTDAQSATIAAYETAWNNGNEDAFRALFAPGAILEDSTFGDLDDVDKIVTWSAARLAMGVELSIDGCVPSGEAVVCTAEFDGVVPIAMNLVPWRDRYIFRFEDGQITNIEVSCIICWDGGADDRLSTWVKTVDDTAWRAGYYGYNGVLTAEAAAFWLEWAPKWQEAGRP